LVLHESEAWDKKKKPASTGGFIWPTVATSLSGYDYSPSLHPGLDIAGAEGNAVFATDSGVVVYSGWSE